MPVAQLQGMTGEMRLGNIFKESEKWLIFTAVKKMFADHSTPAEISALAAADSVTENRILTEVVIAEDSEFWAPEATASAVRAILADTGKDGTISDDNMRKLRKLWDNLQLWMHEKMQRLDSDESFRAERLTRHGSRDGFREWLRSAAAKRFRMYVKKMSCG
eukprot:g2822.t1